MSSMTHVRVSAQFVLAFEIVRWDWGFVSGKGVSLVVESIFIL